MKKIILIIFTVSALLVSCKKEDKAISIAKEHIEITKELIGGIHESPLFGKYPSYLQLRANAGRNIQIALNKEKDNIKYNSKDEDKWGQIYQLEIVQNRARLCADSLINIKIWEIINEQNGKEIPIDYDKRVFGNIKATLKPGNIHSILPEMLIELEITPEEGKSSPSNFYFMGLDENGMAITTKYPRWVKDNGSCRIYTISIGTDDLYLYELTAQHKQY